VNLLVNIAAEDCKAFETRDGSGPTDSVMMGSAAVEGVEEYTGIVNSRASATDGTAESEGDAAWWW